jgi:hypothetical protein
MGKAGLLNESNKPTGYWQIKYDKYPAGVGYMVVYAENKEEAIMKARKLCPTGDNFREPKVVPEQSTYDELYPPDVNGRLKKEF